MSRGLIAIMLVTLVVRLLVALPGGAVALNDVGRYEMEGRTILAGDTIYTDDPAYKLSVYPPPWPYLMAVLVTVGDALSIAPIYLSKAVVALADAGIAGLVYGLLRRRGDAPPRRDFLLVLLLWSLNPLSVLVTAQHGQIDSVHIFFTVAAVAVLTTAPPDARRVWWAGLLVGLGIAVKVTPVLWLPALAFYIDSHYRQQSLTVRLGLIARLGIAAALPYVLSVLPILLGGNPLVIGKTVRLIVGGSSLSDMGFIPAMNLLQIPVRGANTEAVVLPHLGLLGDVLALVLSRGRLLFLGKIAFVGLLLASLWTLYRRDGWTLPGLLTLHILLYFTVGGSSAVHYMLWVIPFALLSRDPGLIPFTLLTIPAVVLFYLYRFPQMLIGPQAPDQFIDLRDPYRVAAGLQWFVGLWWLIWLWRRMMKQTTISPAEPVQPALLGES